jgi:V-type H+-transporting ATPase subunit H
MAYFNDDPNELVEILQGEIPWETYMTARLISDKDLQLIRRYDKRDEELQSSLLDEAGPAYAEAFLSVLRNVSKEETVQYVLALLLQMLSVNPARAKLFHQQSEVHLSSIPDPYTVFLRLLQRQDWFTQEKSCKLLTTIVEHRPDRKTTAFANGIMAGDALATNPVSGGPDPAEQPVTTFMDWLCSQLRRPSNPSKSVPTAVASLSALLRERGCRQLFVKSGGPATLAPLLKAAFTPTTSQLLYELCLCVWQLTYVQHAAEIMAAQGIVKILTEVCRSAQKEKVFRIALTALRNLLNYADLCLAADMVEAGLPKVVATRQLQTWGDEDINEVLSYMEEKLKEGIRTLSNFEKYRQEVLAGSLEWSPMHKSVVFWKENVDKFEEKDFQILRVLLKLIESSQETKNLAVGCHDLGMFITHHPQGRYIVSDLRGKELVMRLMSHPDTEVNKEALMCVQKIMLTKDKLEFLQNLTATA